MADDEIRFVPEPVAEIVGERSAARKKRTPKRPRKVTERYLRNVARWYVERYAPCSGQLRKALMKRVDRGLREHGGDREEAVAWVEAVIAQQIEIGAINDQAYAHAWAASYHRRGVALYGIRQRLRAKRLSAAVIDAAMERLQAESEGDPALAAACAYARRRRFGPFRALPAQREARAEKDLASMMRAGHRYDHVRRILACPDMAAFDLLQAEADGEPSWEGG